MSQGKKFGTFAGVFTPSILTILGVIMYMRLSWVVGNAGLLTAIAIILIAHVVSITTGLSVSSVATDRKIKAGGIYYMLSRSLGLPIGGSIGITLFVATALSIALYLIGFAESALVVLQEPLGIETISINHVRLFGSLALLVIVTIAFISTSIAIKSQFFILGAIILSIISILFGTQEGKIFDLSRANEIESNFFVLFGIFFPAVTGFTAGVAMSGDLKDPKKSIPWGTMLAVGTGLLVYVVLAIFIYYAFSGNFEALISDKNALVTFGLVPVLVIAGIWGATLSSALGGILGAPRILQAMSVDKITPSIFAKGKGAENEPRNALILTFVIAEAGILIGELDVIAEVVAMFYMSAYLFINLSCMLEQWASPDFRPSFKIPIANSLIGTIVTFLLMIQLNLIAAIVAILVMIIIFVWLTRKQLVLGSGDVWQSVWSTIVKLGLKNLDKKSTHKRNWNPNILLFSGGTETRNKLIEFSKIVAGAKGMISNFDLIENKTAKLLFPKHKQSIKDDELDSKGIFARKQECKDVYEGIEAISSTYGFSGIEPNTILTSWEQSSHEPKRFAQLTQKLCDLDYNVLFLDFDKQRGFGGMKMIDIWWNDFSNTTELSLNLAKFMSSSIDWRNATIRVLYVNEDNDKKLQLEEVIHELLSNYRINAKPKIINNQLENKDIYEIMKVESYDSDLVIVGIPDHLDKEEEFVNKTNELVKILGTTLLIRASSHFEETELNFEEKVEESSPEIEEEENTLLDSKSFGYSLLNNLSVFNNRNTTHILETVFSPIYNKYLSLLNLVEETLKENQLNFEKQWSSNDTANFQLLDKTFKEYVKQISSAIEEYNSNFSKTNETVFQDSIASFLNQHEIYLNKLPYKVTRTLSEEELLLNENDSKSEKRAKKWILFKKKIFGISPRVELKYKKLVTYFYQNFYLKIVEKAFRHSGIFVFKNASTINSLSDFIKDEYFKLRSNSTFSKDEFGNSTQLFLSKIEEAKKELENNYKALASCLFKQNKDYTYSLSKKMELISINSEVDINQEEKGKGDYTKQVKSITHFPVNFTRNNRLINNSILLDVSLHEIHPEIDSVIKDTITSINRLSVKPNLAQIKSYHKLDTTLVENQVNIKLELIKFINRLPMFSFDIDELINVTIKKVEKIVYKLPRSLDIMDVESLNNFNEVQDNSVKTNTVQLQRLILFSVENKLIKALNSETDNLQNELNEKIGIFKNKAVAIETINFEKEKEIVNELRDSLRKEVLILEDEIQTRFKNYISKVNEEVEETYAILDYDFIAGNSSVINKYIKKTGVSSSKVIRLINSTKKGIKKRVKQALSFVDNQREEFMISEFRSQHYNKQNLSSIVSGFIDSVKRPSAVLDSIPFFYKKLFLGDHAAPVELENRDLEIKQAQQAISLLNKKSGGAIIVLGEQLSGKKYFADYISSRLLSRNVITINPFIENKTLEKSFEKSTKIAFQNDSILEDNLRQTNGKTIVFNDIEKWGSEIELINRIHKMIEVFGKKHHFILTCDLDYYFHLKEVSSLEEVLISTIIIQPIRKEGFVEALRLKHQAGGMKFILQDKLETEIKNRKKEFLYQKYYAIYRGNIGRAFLGWINNIESVQENEIVIKEPKSVYFPVISNPDWIVVMKLLVLHKEISVRQMNKIFEVDFPASSILNQMKRIKLIEETKSGVYELSAEVYYYVKRYLKDKKVIE